MLKESSSFSLLFLQIRKISKILKLISSVIISEVFWVTIAERVPIIFFFHRTLDLLFTQVSSFCSIKSSTLYYNKVT